MIDLTLVPLLLSPNRGDRRGKDVPRERTQLIVLHTSEGHERAGSARALGLNWFARPGAKVSATFGVDASEVVAYTAIDQLAWHAGPANGVSIGIEQCGKANQSGPSLPGSTDGAWFDADSSAMLENLCDLLSALCTKYHIEARKLDSSEVGRILAGDTTVTGLCGHVDVPGATHWDPGPGYPWLQVLLGTRARLGLVE